YLNGLYWTDFATPTALFALFAAFAGRPVVRGAVLARSTGRLSPWE
ncbi:MAG: hypothetical protein JWL73_3879, partial [Actinomycetia bacterium]|nr:hypothetical protein [Actinomycetes bacterium]